MATTQRTNQDVSDAPAQIDDVVLERRSWNYAYIGEDEEGRHHHIDRKLERVVVTNSRADRDDSGAVPVFTLEGPILHARRVSEHPDADGTDDGVAIWIDFIDEHVGWAERPVSAADRLQDALAEGLR
ncbi:hypothetical protein [Halosolutus gelatinilyticus]|uniref:hypothetical protein n=1 Tax=Halosolutus gelatinilyticus TaxID=2931975 RepID=UPI001FF2E01E|nr:hypothetical protein [Halosolutus gelatinilyticus]